LTHSLDTLRSARLLFSEELASGKLTEDELGGAHVADVLKPKPFARRPIAALERLAMKLGLVTYERNCLTPLVEARRAVLGAAAAGPPRLLVRVDEFPHAEAYDRGGPHRTDEFMRFHSIMRSAGVPYLLAVSPRVSDRYLEPGASGSRAIESGEQEALIQLRDEGVTMALHGYEHRTRHRSPRRRSELEGLSAGELSELLDRAMSTLTALGLELPAFVPPFNRFDPVQYPLLADRFDIVCGGPETVALVGFQPTPQWRGDAVYLPAYPPLYGRASAILPALEEIVKQQPGTWVPVVIHWGWEADDGRHALEKLASTMAPLAASWEDFLHAAAEARVAISAEESRRSDL
jgi:hypothetical protein